MKKTLTLILAFICVGLFAQEKQWFEEDTIIDVGYWVIPNGVDTSQQKDIWHTYVIPDSTVKSKIIPSKYYFKQKQINDSVWYYNEIDYYEWVMYENFSKKAQMYVTKKTRKTVPSDPKDILLMDVEKEILYLKKQGVEDDRVRQMIDSTYYNINNIKP